MKLYNALVKKTKLGTIEDVVVFKDGFSFPAFFFNNLWFLYHKMWKEFGVLLLLSFVFILLKSLGILSSSDVFLLEIVMVFMIALNFNYWLVDHLKKQGYEFVGLVFGVDEISAKMRFVKNLEENQKTENFAFDIAISDPKMHRQILKMKKREHYFTV